MVSSSPAISQQDLARADELHRLAARMHPDPFLEYVLRDEESGGIIEQASIHKAWQDLASRYKRLLIWAHVEAGKSQQISVGRVLWELGRNPSLRIAIVSNTQEQASKIIRALAKYIEHSEELHLIFPELRKGETWTTTQLTVQRPTVSKDPSVQAFGVHGNILGARIDLLILDDVLDYENCRTPKLRQDLWDWYHATLSGRLTRDAKALVIGTAFHPDDLLHRFAQQQGWHAVRYPVIDPKTGRPRWPERWSMARIEEKRTSTPPIEFARQMLCVARDDSQSRWKQQWIDNALRRGADKVLAHALEHIPPGCRVYTGVDLAVQRHSAAGETVLFDLLIHPNEDREVLNIEAGKWTGPEIIQRVYDHHKRYQSISIVENNAAQDFIIQFATDKYALPIKPFTTGRNKAHPEFGVESLAAEMASGKWIIPNKGGIDPEVSEWINEMLYYDPTAHTGDRLMASWFAREGANMSRQVVEYGRLDLTSR